VRPGRQRRAGPGDAPASATLPTLLASLALLALLAACGGEAPGDSAHAGDAAPTSAGAGPTDGSSVRDSAGITIVESASPAWAPGEAWTLGDSATLEITGEPGSAAALVRPWARDLPDGRILVSDAGLRQLRIYRPDGSLVRTFGAQGRLAGEFVLLGPTFSLPGDTVVATDPSTGRITIFGPDGALADTLSLARRGDGTVVDGVLEPRQWVAAADLPAPDSAGLGGRREEIGIYGPEGRLAAVVDTLTAFRSISRLVGDRRLGVPLPFAPKPSIVADDGRIFVAGGDRFEVRVYDDRGVLRRVLRRAHRTEPVTDADVSAYVDRVRERLARTSASESARAAILAMNEEAARLSAAKPAIGSLALDADGNLWVAGWTTGWEPSRSWSVFNPAGRWLGDVDAPDGLWITDVADDHVWVRSAQDGAAPGVRRLPLRKPASGATHEGSADSGARRPPVPE
jgi:hypothetical protein